MTELKQKGNQGIIRVIEAFEYENSKGDFKCQTTAKYTRNPRKIFR